MRRVAAPLAAVLLGLAAAGCGGDGAEPGAPRGATLVLDFQPNAVHSGIYAAQADGAFDDAGVELTIREPSESSDAPKLLEAGQVEFAVMDINDLGIARERGLDLVAIAAIVQRPLASVIARDRESTRTAADLEGSTVGVTGVPSDEAVLDTVLASGGVDPDSIERVTIGFNSVSALAAGRIDAATAFWNAEGVELRHIGVPTREFRVDEFGAPRYPELVVASSRSTIDRDQELVCGLTRALERGYELLGEDPDQALGDLLRQVEGLDRASQAAQLDALVQGHAFSASDDDEPTIALSDAATDEWVAWVEQRGLLGRPADRSLAIADGFAAEPDC